ncbi:MULTISPECIES: UxaA family hydrolase [Haloferax]|uniref:(2R)-sulfolactate sulfo-lyase subunit beta n=1 Tax=Haloferax massiliensis TaxID=1476858 RepID=A0A0D6JUC8_9EURY|nr:MULTISPECIES: UxaA family hydrolase [Haloferax]MDS0241465.1 UxaA family hydrolase [Haloferax sp. S2CR25]MDS0444586.1 UxaA family hydrolase [Haloferax sp. S2CR25-2]CQR52047.1 (2R)-sulfolactate sulfo-lyase subunit beta [Haloferax massiliensis]
MGHTFEGYRRSNGRVGVRNHVAVVPTSVAASSVASAIADEAGAWARATPHQLGTSQPDPARRQTERVLVGTGRNPNVGAALVVELGTEDIDAETVADGIATAGKATETLTIREAGGTANALSEGADRLGRLKAEADRARREEADVSELVFGVECGGSDATSGIAANPAVGAACDRLVEADGTASFSETPEFIGAEHILADRCVSEETRERILERVEAREGMAELMGVDLRGAQPTPGNQEGGLTTIEEKSLGAISKGGTTPIRGIVDYGDELPTNGGLVLMDTPGYDVESVVGKVAGGAQVVAFTTGRGSTTGNPLAPVIKVTGNPKTWDRMSNNIDVNAGTVFDGESIDSVGARIFETLVEVANGRRTEAEHRRLEEFAINEIQPEELTAEVSG